jgi:hypothetical protein
MPTVQVVDNLALVPLTQTEVATFNLAALGVITITNSGGGGGNGDMMQSVFATINPGAGYVDKALVATQVPYTGITSLPGGTALFLRADGTFAAPPGQVYGVVTTTVAGLVPILPGSSGFSYYLRGDGSWQLTSGLSIGWAQLTAIPLSFPPSPHAATHRTSGSDPIGPPTTSTNGLVPVLPVAANQPTYFLRGDATWNPIPIASITAPGLSPQLPNNALTFYRGDGSFAQPVYSQLASIPATFAPSPHESTHVTGGTDVIPNFAISGATSGLVPGSPGGSSAYLRADGTWNVPPGGGGVASSSGAGLMNQLPSTNQITYYWGGDNEPHLISGLSLTYSQITGVPIFAGSSAGLVPTSAGGTANFLRADGVYAAPAGSVVTTSSIGAVAQLPATAGATYYLNGANAWTLLSTLSITWSQIASGTIPTSFTPSAHAATHRAGGSDPIGPPTTSQNGLVPVLPTVSPTTNFLRGDASWASIPVATGTTSGLLPAPNNNTSFWLRGDATFQQLPAVSTTVAGIVAPFPGNLTTFLSGSGTWISVPYSSISGVPTTFTPTAHATTHISGGTATDLIPVFTSSSTGLVPVAGSAGTYLNSSGTWTTPTGSGDVLHTETLTGQQSIAGGGDLSAPRTFNLVNDQTTPAASSFYGTNSGGTRGWFASVSMPQATSSVAGLVPTPTGSAAVFLSGAATFITPPAFTATTPGYAPLSGGGTVNFLRADGGWAAPPSAQLATTSSGGIIPALQSSSQASYYLRGDDTWQLISALSIAFTQITGVPVFSGTTTAGLVPANSGGSAAVFLRGDGNFATPLLASSGTSGYLAGLPSSAATNYWLRGDNSWELPLNSILISSPFTMPAVGSAVTNVPVNSTVILDLGMTLFMGVQGSDNSTECFMEVTGIGVGLVNLTNQGYQTNPAPGTQIPGGQAFIIGPGVAAGTSAGFVPTLPNNSNLFLNGQGSWQVPPGAGGLSTVTTQYSVSGTGSVGSPVQLVSDQLNPGPFRFYSTDATGNRGWLPLSYSWETNGTFVLPGVGATVNVAFVTNVGMTVGSTIVVEDSNVPPNQAFLEVISVNGDGIHAVLNNRGYAFSTTGSVTFATSSAVTLAGPGVAAGGKPGFVPASLNDTINFLRSDGTFSIPPTVTVGAVGYAPSAPGGTTQFLRGDATWAVPAVGALATTGTAGAVAGLPATNQATSVLRGDNTWVLMSTLSAQIAYASLSGLPMTFAPSAHASSHISTGADPISNFSTSTTTSGLVPGSNGVGTTFFLRADGTWATTPSGPGLATTSAAGLLAQLPASAGATYYANGLNAFALISSLSIAYSQLTGVPSTFTPSGHEATHLDNGTDTIPVVAGVRTGLVPVLPSSAPTAKFLRGDATWTVVPNVTGSTPGLITAYDGNTAHFFRGDGTYAVVPAVSTSVAGLAPVLPASNGTSQWLRGDATWVNIPFYWTISASFTQPAISGTVSVTFLSTTNLQAGMCIATVDTTPVTNYYTVQSIANGTTAVLVNLGATGNTAAASTVNAGQVNLNGPPVMTSTGAGITPVPTGNSTQFLCANGSWVAPPTTGVPLTRNVNTQYSLTGGGQLNADLTLNLVNDTASPGNSMVYGTSSGGTRGWFASNSFPLATSSNAGLLLTLTGSTSNFLRADGTWSAPSGLALASTGVAGIVAGLPATGQTTQWLRADNSWAFLPDSNATTASFSLPAVGSTVSVTFTSTSNWDVGMTLFFATGSGATCCYLEVTTVTDGTHLVMTNQGYITNPAPVTTIPTCLVFVVSPGVAKVSAGAGNVGLVPLPPNTTTTFLRGDATWAAVPTWSGTTTAGLVPGTSSGSTSTYLRGDGTFATPPGGASTTAGANFTWPAVGSSTSSILVGSSSQMMVGAAVYVPAFGVAEVTSIADSTHCVLRNNGNSGNATSGTVNSGTSIFIGTAGALATTTASGMLPVPPNDATKVLLGTGAFGTLAYSSLGSIPTAPPLHEATHVTGGTDVIGPATTSVSGLVPVLPASNGTDKWLRGDSSWVQGPPLAISTATFTWPAVAGTVTVTVDSSSNMRQNMGLYAPGLGVCEVTAVNSGTSITIRNNGNTNNAGSTASQQPAFYAAGVGGLATATTSGMIPVPPNNTTTFLSGAATFITPPSATATVAGYVPTPPNNVTTFLRGDATFATPPSATATTVGYVPTPPNNTYQYLRGDATWTTPTITYSRFKASDNIPFSTTYPAFNTRGAYGLPVLDCAQSVRTDMIFIDAMPINANLGSGVNVLIHWSAHTATTGNVVWDVAFARLNAAASIASTSFGTANTVTSATTGTVDQVTISTVAVTSGNLNSVAAGDVFVVNVYRLGTSGSDTMADIAEVHFVEIRSAGT